MGHSYTPGLRVAADAIVRRERRLPLRGEVLGAVGERVEPGQVVARTRLPGNVQSVNLAGRLGVDPARVGDYLVQPLGSEVRRGDIIARAKGLFGLVTNTVEAPADGVVESLSTVTGQLLLREPPIPVEVAGYLQGRIVEVLDGEGVIVEARGALIQGIFGVGGETFGRLVRATATPDEPLEATDLRPEHRGAVVFGGRFITVATVRHAVQLGIAAIVVGGFDDRDLREWLGRDLGVAITGHEDLGLTLVLTEGFGPISMAARTWELLVSHEGRVASVSGATQIRAGVQRPEIVVAHELGASQPMPAAEDRGSLEIGSAVRVIREPEFGRIGRVVELPSEPRALETEALVRVLVVEFSDDHSQRTLPRTNIERNSG